MKAIGTLSRYFGKKNRQDIITFNIILFLATILFTAATTIALQIDRAYDRTAADLHTADCFFTVPTVMYRADILTDIQAMDGVTSAETRDGIMLSVAVAMDGATQEQNQIFYRYPHNGQLNQATVVTATDENLTNGIYLANYTYRHAGLKLKDAYPVTVNHVTYTFAVQGVINEMQYGNYTAGVIGAYLTAAAYDDFAHAVGNDTNMVTTLAIQADDSHAAYQAVTQYLSQQNVSILHKNYQAQIKNQRLAISHILVLIFICFAAAILLISLFVSQFKIKQTIEAELANMGVLKAQGYTNRVIMAACCAPYLLSGLLTTLLGVIGSYAVLPLFANIIEMQSGFPWSPRVDVLANGLVLLLNLLLITVFTVTAAGRIRRLTPMNAIRGTDSQRTRHLPLPIAKTKGNIHVILMLKNFLNAKKQNTLLGIMLLLITCVATFMTTLFFNVNVNPLNFVNTLVEEHPSLVVVTDTDLRSDFQAMDNVKHALYYDENGTVLYQGNNYKTFVAESYQNLANDLCYQGRNPQNAQEVAVGSQLVETYHLHLNDQITFTKNGHSATYTVVGMIQSVNYAGEVLEMTIDGYQILDSTYQPQTIYVYLHDEDQAAQMITHVQATYGNQIQSTLNYAESMNSATTMYVSLISVVSVVMIVIGLLLIALVLSMVIASIIAKQQQALGIYKALGYSNHQLVSHIVGGLLPSTLLGTLLGWFISQIGLRHIYTGIFRAVGAYKVSFVYPPLLLLGVTAALIAATLGIATLMARKIRRISAYALMKD